MRCEQTKAHQLEPDGASAEFMRAAIATYEDADILGPINPGLKPHNVCVQYSTLLQCTTAQITITLANIKHIMRISSTI